MPIPKSNKFVRTKGNKMKWNPKVNNAINRIKMLPKKSIETIDLDLF